MSSEGPSRAAHSAPSGGSAAAKPQAWGGLSTYWAALALVTPALVVVAVFFVMPLVLSAIGAFRSADGGITLAHFEKSLELYTRDLVFTLAIVVLSTVLIAFVAIAIAGYLTLGESPRAVAVLRWLYRWPLFIPFVVTGQVMRTFLAKNGMLNHALIGTGLIDLLGFYLSQAWNTGWPIVLGVLLLVIVMFRPTGLIGLLVSDRERVGFFGRPSRGEGALPARRDTPERAAP